MGRVRSVVIAPSHSQSHAHAAGVQTPRLPESTGSRKVATAMVTASSVAQASSFSRAISLYGVSQFAGGSGNDGGSGCVAL